MCICNIVLMLSTHNCTIVKNCDLQSLVLQNLSPYDILSPMVHGKGSPSPSCSLPQALYMIVHAQAPLIRCHSAVLAEG